MTADPTTTAVVAFLAREGGSATAFEVARAVGVSSLAELEPTLLALEASGAVVRGDGAVRLSKRGAR